MITVFAILFTWQYFSHYFVGSTSALFYSQILEESSAGDTLILVLLGLKSGGLRRGDDERLR